jgi:hypothetical protein
MDSSPRELIIDLCLRMYGGNISDSYNLQSLACTCTYIYDIMSNDRDRIVRHYLRKCLHGGRNATIIYKFGAVNHSIDDQPAITTIDGVRKWYHFGKLHRGNDQPAVISININHERGEPPPWARGIVWPKFDIIDEEYLHGSNNRYPITMEWWSYGTRHRAGLPAIAWGNGKVEYWVEGKRMSIKKHRK